MKEVIKELYELKPLELMKIQGLHIRRVPGGWIFETPDSDGNGWNPVFVPFNNEFQPKEKP